MAAIGGLKNAAASEHESMILAHEVNIVDGVIDTQTPFNPTRAGIFSVSEKTAVAAGPTMLRIAEINSIEIFSAGVDVSAGPAALRIADNRPDIESDQYRQQSCTTEFTNHWIRRVLHIKVHLTKAAHSLTVHVVWGCAWQPCRQTMR